MTDFLTLASVEDILRRIDEFPPLPAEKVSLSEAGGRVLAEAFAAPEDLPGFARSTMDGYAVRARSVFGASETSPALLDFVGEGPMARPPELAVGPGQAARIWTGGMLPPGADAVVMLEYSRPAGNQVELTRPVAPLENVIGPDEDARRGEELIPAGRVLGPAEVGLLAALGRERAAVRRRPRVGVISSGDEVVAVAERPAPGQVRDINAHSLAALIRAAGGEARLLGLVPDDVERLAGRVAEGLAWADAVVVSGGSSAGRRDCTRRAFESLAGVEILAHGVAISPGKPLILARRGESSLWGLPGHAASALVCAEVFLRPLLARLTGRTGPLRPRGLRAVLTRPVASAQGRRDFIRVRLADSDDPAVPLSATPVLGQSGLITTLVEADALVVCPEDREGLDAGQVVDVLLTL